ncbi:MAG: ATPase, T2SS/T4P/T4SS family [Thermodesulfobacteriaceae bacterium]|nr:ATPase, T2SS/T4P/T4SS family [Thermodesulfobacteriaceae bacterium]
MKIGEILVKKFGVSSKEIERALDIQKKVGGYIGQILLSEGIITEKQLLLALSEQLNIPIFQKENFQNFEEFSFFDLETNLDIEFLIKNQFVPLKLDKEKQELILLTNDPLNLSVRSYLNQKVSYKVKLYLADENTLTFFSKWFKKTGEEYKTLEEETSIEKLKEIAFEAPVIKYLNQLFTQAVEHRATDIHIEPVGNQFRVRLRVDGILHEIDTLEKSFYLAVVSRIKLLAGLDIAEKRLPQDGKIALRVASTFLDLRVSTIPVVEGESVVLRLLYKERLSFEITSLGLEKDHENLLLRLISQPFGMILITGPTGSGKTTTLYSILTRLNSEERKIITVEDPVEYQLEGINQIQVKPEIGLTFANALRSILRHDPDIIMIGEIRDKETAEIAIHSALTGHLVLSTLHTNDAPSALFRLIEMGLEDYLLNASIIGLMAQRIVRKVCPFCAKEVSLDKVIEQYQLEDLLKTYSNLLNGALPKKGEGCSYCLQTGYHGRIAIFELLIYEDELKEIFVKTKSLETLRRILKEKYNFRNLREDGFLKVLKGITTPEEVLRVA